MAHFRGNGLNLQAVSFPQVIFLQVYFCIKRQFCTVSLLRGPSLLYDVSFARITFVKLEQNQVKILKTYY